MVIKVLVVDDSTLMRNIIIDILTEDPTIEIIGSATNGEEALSMISKFRPDVVTLDIEMPKINGIEVLRTIMKNDPIPVIMLSSHIGEEAYSSVEALSIGAVEVVKKPVGIDNHNLKTIGKELIDKVKVAAESKHLQKFTVTKQSKINFTPTMKKVVVIASSTGGPQTIEAILKTIPKNIPAPILIAQHMPKGFTKLFADRLDRCCEISVKEAMDGERIQNGVAYITPADYHMELLSNSVGEEIVKINQNPKQLGVRPCANILMTSVANLYKDKTIGLVLTGMGTDGTIGAQEIKKFQGTVLVEAEESCIIYGMPKSVVESGYFDMSIEISKIGPTITQLVGL